MAYDRFHPRAERPDQASWFLDAAEALADDSDDEDENVEEEEEDGVIIIG